MFKFLIRTSLILKTTVSGKKLKNKMSFLIDNAAANSTNITEHLSVILNAWHFQFKVGFRVYGATV